MHRHPHARSIATFALALLAMTFAGAANAGPYTRLQVLLPGETAAPGTTSGKTGTPRAQTAGVPFTITVRACDATWTTVATVTNAIKILCSDGSATLPPDAQLTSGQRIFNITLNAGGTFSIQAHDLTDGTIPDGASSPVTSLVIQTIDISSIGKNQNVGSPVTVTITARTPSGQVVAGFNGNIRLRQFTSFGEGRTSPEVITLSAGTWTGGVSFFRADATNHPRGNVYLQAELESAPSKNGASNPFLVYAGSFARLQLVVPGQTVLPGSVAGSTGTPSSQSAGASFNVTVWATDAYWNPVGTSDVARITSSDPAFTPVSGGVGGSSRVYSVTLRTVGSQTLTVSDQSRPSITGMTSPPISVIPSAANQFAISTVPSPVIAGVPVPLTVRATDASGNTVPNYNGDALLIANTGAGSISPELITFTAGVWTGSVVFRGAGGAVRLTCSDFSSPPHMGTSNSFVVQAGPFFGLQVLLPGETPQGGTADGKNGTPTPQSAGSPFTLTLRAVDAYWNLVSGVNDRVALASNDVFAGMPAETTLANGQRLFPVRLYQSGTTRIWASDVDQPAIRPDTSSAVTVTGGSFNRLLILAPGESPAPGTASGRTGTPTDQSINYAFTVTVLATDSWFNPVGGVSDMVHLTSNDPLAQLGANEPLVNGRTEMSVRLATGGFQQITASDVTNPARSSSTTQVRAISSGFHLEATVSPASAQAGAPFTLHVQVTNDAGSVIQEINSIVTVEVQNSNTRNPGRGTLLSAQFQLLNGQRTVSETYTFAEPIVLVVQDDAGNAPGVTNEISIVPGNPDEIHLDSDPTWVGGNKHALLSARLVDEFENGIPDRAMVFTHLSGGGTINAIDSLTNTTGLATADFLSGRNPGHDMIRASSGGVIQDLDLETAFIDPTTAGGTVTNYPNPFHPPLQGTSLAWKLDDHASVTIRIFTQTGDLVREETFARGAPGGTAGLNGWVWDGRNGQGAVVASGGYVALVEAQGTGQTLHVMRRKIAVVR